MTTCVRNAEAASSILAPSTIFSGIFGMFLDRFAGDVPHHTPRFTHFQSRLNHAAWLLSVLLAGCNNVAPTGPSSLPAPYTPPVAEIPIPSNPPPSVPPPNPLLTDPRFSLTFYRQFVNNAYERPNQLEPLRRQTQAPRIYLRTVDDGGSPIDTLTLNQTAEALESTTGQLTGVFGLAGIERGTDTREGQPGWITVRWSNLPNENGNNSVCGQAQIGGGRVILYPRSRFCRCSGGPAVTLTTVKHELGHSLGFYHTDSRQDLMYPLYSACDQQPSAREVYHARIAYGQPLGSFDPR